jgi:hypothetical protein
VFDPVTWGTIGQWVSGGATASAFIAGVSYYILDRRSDRRSQASLIYVKRGGGIRLKVYNRSDKAIFDVRVVVSVMNVITAARSGEFDSGTLFGGEPVEPFPSHEFYTNVNAVLKRMKKRSFNVMTRLADEEIGPGEQTEISVPELMHGAVEFHLTFKDARGKDWAMHVDTKELRAAHPPRHLLRSLRNNTWAVWWVTKNESRLLWDHYLYHPKGRPPRRE